MDWGVSCRVVRMSTICSKNKVQPGTSWRFENAMDSSSEQFFILPTRSGFCVMSMK